MDKQFSASEVHERERFEEWYTTHACNYSRDPIGSRDCSLQWESWKAALAAHSAQAQPPAASVPDGFLRHVAAVCMGAVENCRPKASLIPEDPQEHNGGLCLNELTHIAGEIDRMLAAQENPNG